jgi:hypothetical protein
MQPLIEYFDALKTKYADDSKPARKMRYSAYYNLAVIYLLAYGTRKDYCRGREVEF